MIINFIKIIYLLIIKKETYGNAIFAINVAKLLFTNKKNNRLFKNKSILRKLQIAQDMIDDIQSVLPNSQTKNDVYAINKNKDTKTFKDFSAKIVKDKHGKGNDGIQLGMKTKLLGENINLGNDPSEIKGMFGVGPFSLQS